MSLAWQAGPQHSSPGVVDGSRSVATLFAGDTSANPRNNGRPDHCPCCTGLKDNHLDPCLLCDTHVEQERIKHAPLPDSIPERMTAGLALSMARRPRPCRVCGRLQCSGARPEPTAPSAASREGPRRGLLCPHWTRDAGSGAGVRRCLLRSLRPSRTVHLRPVEPHQTACAHPENLAHQGGADAEGAAGRRPLPVSHA